MVTRSWPAVIAVPVLSLVLLGGCTSAAPAASTGAPPSSAPASSAPASSAPASPPATADAATLALKTADSTLGSIVVDGKGMTLYMFTKDTKNTSNCSGQCLVAWPALIGKPTQGKGVDDSKLGSFTRSDGTVQASYNGWPLYYWQKDTKPGYVTGQNVNSVWFVLDHDGNPVKG